MLRKQLTSMILLFRQVQTAIGFKQMGTTALYFLFKEEATLTSGGAGAAGLCGGSSVLRVFSARDKLSQDVSVTETCRVRTWANVLFLAPYSIVEKYRSVFWGPGVSLSRGSRQICKSGSWMWHVAPNRWLMALKWEEGQYILIMDTLCSVGLGRLTAFCKDFWASSNPSITPRDTWLPAQSVTQWFENSNPKN